MEDACFSLRRIFFSRQKGCTSRSCRGPMFGSQPSPEAAYNNSRACTPHTSTHPHISTQIKAKKGLQSVFIYSMKTSHIRTMYSNHTHPPLPPSRCPWCSIPSELHVLFFSLFTLFSRLQLVLLVCVWVWAMHPLLAAVWSKQSSSLNSHGPKAADSLMTVVKSSTHFYSAPE